MKRWLLLLVVVAGLVATAGPAQARKACGPPDYPGSGYFTSLTVRGVGCGTGTAVLKAHYKCRIKHGLKGKCGAKVKGYSCAEHREAIPTEFNSRVTCTKGTKTVIYTYQQNT